jgi:hypothetical protein
LHVYVAGDPTSSRRRDDVGGALPRVVAGNRTSSLWVPVGHEVAMHRRSLGWISRGKARVGVSGSGEVRINGGLHCLAGGSLIFIPKGAQRSTCGVSADFAYLTLHRRRDPLRVGVPKRNKE